MITTNKLVRIYRKINAKIPQTQQKPKRKKKKKDDKARKKKKKKKKRESKIHEYKRADKKKTNNK
jgi:hypothetical protein